MTATSDFEQLFNTMLQFGKLMSQHTQETREERTATILQFSALNFIKEKPHTTVSDLSEPLQLSKSSATQLVERLVKSGFVNRINDHSDRRIMRVEITKEGENQLKELKAKMVKKMQKIFSKIPAKDTRELIRIHTNLIEALKNDHDK